MYKENIRKAFCWFNMVALWWAAYTAAEVVFTAITGHSIEGYTNLIVGFNSVWSMIVLAIINKKLSYKMDILLQMLIVGTAIEIGELVIGFTAEYLFHTKLWDYSGQLGSINGYVSLPMAGVFYIASLWSIVTYDWFSFLYRLDDERPEYRLFGKTIIKVPEWLLPSYRNYIL